MSGIEWRDPPSDLAAGSREAWAKRLAPLMEQSGRWAVIAKLSPARARQLAWMLNTSRFTRPPGEWQFVSRSGEVFGRYIGPKEES